MLLSMKRQGHFQPIQAANIINTEADACVKCAICSPVCPTYQLTHNESESPRGRIALAQGLVNHQIPLTAITRTHLDHCLSCLACEAVCPSGVKYGKLFDETQALIEAQAPRPLTLIEKMPRLLSSKTLLSLLRFYQRSPLQPLLRKLNFLGLQRLKQYDAALPLLKGPSIVWQDFYPAIGKERGQVALFLGCTRQLDEATLLDAITVLTTVGYAVQVPLHQGCCGALDLHAGRQGAYRAYLEQNHNAFEGLHSKTVKAIISLNSGCSVVLAKTLAPVRDLFEFLNTESWNPEISLQPYSHTVWLHTPCTLKNGLKTDKAVEQLLRRIPQIDLKLIPTTVGCCGAAGSHFLRYPEEANALLSKTMAVIHTEKESLVLTTNIGCQLHIAQGFKTEKIASTIFHPVRLLAKQLCLG